MGIALVCPKISVGIFSNQICPSKTLGTRVFHLAAVSDAKSCANRIEIVLELILIPAPTGNGRNN